MTRRPALAIFFVMAGLLATSAPRSAEAADSLANSATCKELQAKYPQFKGKTLVDAVNPHTPGYEALDPQDPSKYIGFDIDLVRGDRRLPGLQGHLQVCRLRRVADRRCRAARRTSSSPTSMRPRSAPRRPTSSPIPRCSTACWWPRAIPSTSPASIPRCAARRRPRTPASSRCRWSRPGGRRARRRQGGADVAALRQQRRLHPGDPGRPRRHLRQRRQHRRPGGQGVSRQARKGGGGHPALFGRHRRAEGQDRVPRRDHGGAGGNPEGGRWSSPCSRSGHSTPAPERSPALAHRANGAVRSTTSACLTCCGASASRCR